LLHKGAPVSYYCSIQRLARNSDDLLGTIGAVDDRDGELGHEDERDEEAIKNSRVHTIRGKVRVILAEGDRSYKTPGGAAELKIQRAKDHFLAFRAELQEYYSQPPWTIKPVRDGADLALVLDSHLPVPDSLALIAGDLLYNVRSALDCIVMELAELGLGSLGRPPSGQEERLLNFPISESQLPARKEELLARFLAVDSLVLLRLLQPVETTRRRLIERGHKPDSIADELLADHLYEDLLLKLNTLNNWDKHRRLTFSFLVPQSVSDGSDVGKLEVVSGPGELADLRGIGWLGLEEPRQIVIDDPDVLADMEAQMRAYPEPDYHFHFSWWPLTAGDEIGRYIPFPGCGPIPDITTQASLQLVLFEPDLFRKRQRMATPADRLLAEIIEEVEYAVALLRDLSS
jgi:hypothetical protein